MTERTLNIIRRTASVITILGWGIVALFIIISLASCARIPPAADAKASCAAWSADLGYELLGCSCSNRDSDWDGYISCTARVKSNDGEDRVNLECTYSGQPACKAAIPQVVQQ